MNKNKILTTIIIILIVLTFAHVFFKSVNAITGTNNENNINITRGQLDIAPISGGSTIILRGATQDISEIGDGSSTKTRFGILEANKVPTISIQYPPNNSYFDNETVKFNWTSNDSDSNTITSMIEIYNDTDLTEFYHVNLTLEESSNTTSKIFYYTLTIPEEIALYYRIISNDSELNSSYSDLLKFTTDYTAPTSFNLTSPANETSSTDTTPELTWLAPTETNLDNYTVEFCTDSNCGSATHKGISTTTDFSNWTTDNALDQGTHYWQVRATDKVNNQNTSSLFIYTVEASDITTITTTTGGGGGELVGGTGTQLYSLSIISPPDITIYSNDTLTIPLIVNNPARLITLRGIELNVSSDSEDVSPLLATTFIPQLRPKEQRTVPLTIETHTEPGTYGITITAHVIKPDFTDKVRILANLIEKDSADKKRVSKQLGFAKDLLNGNPECLDLIEYLNEAQSSLNEGKHDQALSLVENAIESCQKLISTKRISVTPPLLEIPYIIQENKDIVIIILESLGFILFLLIIYKIVKKKKPTTSKS